MRMLAWLGAALLILAPRAFAQSLPDLGGAGEAALTPQMERRIGENVLRDIRLRDPTYVDDPEVSGYLSALGARLAQVTPGVRHDFEYFVMRDASVNAFAMPGGFVGVHTGLLLSADTESELAAVLAHEIAHVTERHISRMIGRQQKLELPMIVAIAAAILLSRSRPDLAGGAAVAAQAGAVQSQLAYTREFEREADRVGMQTLQSAGFDVRAMPLFFEKLQRSYRVSDDGSVPGYLRTHPLTVERIADAQNRSAGMPYRQHLDSPDFQMVRAKLRSEIGEADDAVRLIESLVREKRHASEAAARYGLANALLRARRATEAEAELARARAAGAAGPMVETLAARVKSALKDQAGAVALLSAARKRFSYSRALLYAHIAALDESGRHQEALAELLEPIRLNARDARLFELLAKTYAALGKRSSHHQAQGEFYALRGSLPAAIEQLEFARSAGDGDFYQQSVVDSRLRELRVRHAQEVKDAKR